MKLPWLIQIHFDYVVILGFLDYFSYILAVN